MVAALLGAGVVVKNVCLLIIDYIPPIERPIVFPVWTRYEEDFPLRDIRYIARPTNQFPEPPFQEKVDILDWIMITNTGNIRLKLINQKHQIIVSQDYRREDQWFPGHYAVDCCFSGKSNAELKSVLMNGRPLIGERMLLSHKVAMSGDASTFGKLPQHFIQQNDKRVAKKRKVE